MTFRRGSRRWRDPVPGPWPVGLGEPNTFGLYGIAANVHEWCADWYAADFYVFTGAEPLGPAHGSGRASRGGSWRHAITISRPQRGAGSIRRFATPTMGFRVARDKVSGSGSLEGRGREIRHPLGRPTSRRRGRSTRTRHPAPNRRASSTLNGVALFNACLRSRSVDVRRRRGRRARRWPIGPAVFVGSSGSFSTDAPSTKISNDQSARLSSRRRGRR